MEKYTLTRELIMNIGKYLMSQPYGNVHRLIEEINAQIGEQEAQQNSEVETAED